MEAEFRRLQAMKLELDQFRAQAGGCQGTKLAGPDVTNGVTNGSAPRTEPPDSTVDASVGNQGKGKGKGKGKFGPGRPPPPKAPPPAAAAALAAKGGRASATGRSNPFMNLHWKVINEAPSKKVLQSETKDRLRQQAKRLVEEFSEKKADDQEAKFHQESQTLPEVAPVSKDEASNKSLRTIFEGNDGTMPKPPIALLEAYFSKRLVAVKASPEGRRSGSAREGRQSALIDGKRLQMLGILLRKHLMAHKDQDVQQAIISLKRAVLRCDYGIVQQEGLSVIRLVLRQHASDGSKVSEFAREFGEAALQQLEHPWHHRLVHELLKVPQIDERLECMLFASAYPDGLKKCSDGLETLCLALQALSQKRQLLQKFFCTAHRLGQSLNKDSAAPLASRGFKLSSLEQLTQTKSTKSPRHTVMHCVLALLSREEALQLFTDRDMQLLTKAKAFKSFIVYQDCIELLQGFSGVREICQSGSYKRVRMERRRITMAPSKRRPKEELNEEVSEDDELMDGAKSAIEAPVDADDCFHEMIATFIAKHQDEVNYIARGCFGAFSAYKDLALFFDDLDSVYPPPRTEQDIKVDLMAVLHRLAENVQKFREDVDRDGLRRQLGQEPASVGGA